MSNLRHYTLTLACLMGGLFGTYIFGFVPGCLIIALAISAGAFIQEHLLLHPSRIGRVSALLAHDVFGALLLLFAYLEEEWPLRAGYVLVMTMHWGMGLYILLGLFKRDEPVRQVRKMIGSRRFDGVYFYVEGRDEQGPWKVCWCPDCGDILEEHCAGDAICRTCHKPCWPTVAAYRVPAQERYWLDRLTILKPVQNKPGRVSRNVYGVLPK